MDQTGTWQKELVAVMSDRFLKTMVKIKEAQPTAQIQYNHVFNESIFTGVYQPPSKTSRKNSVISKINQKPLWADKASQELGKTLYNCFKRKWHFSLIIIPFN